MSLVVWPQLSRETDFCKKMIAGKGPILGQNGSQKGALFGGLFGPISPQNLMSPSQVASRKGSYFGLLSTNPVRQAGPPRTGPFRDRPGRHEVLLEYRPKGPYLGTPFWAMGPFWSPLDPPHHHYLPRSPTSPQ